MFARDAILHGVWHPLPFSLAAFHGVAALERVAPAVVDELQRGNIVYDHARRAARVKRKTALAPSFFAAYSDAQAILAAGCLDTLVAGNERRRTLAERLHARLAEAGVPRLVRLDPRATPTFWRYPLWTPEPQTLRGFLRRRGIDTAGTNLFCASREPAFADARASTPNAEAFVDRMIFLPLHPNLDERDMDHIARSVAAFRGP